MRVLVLVVLAEGDCVCWVSDPWARRAVWNSATTAAEQAVQCDEAGTQSSTWVVLPDRRRGGVRVRVRVYRIGRTRRERGFRERF
jgi:hypothetical protein